MTTGAPYPYQPPPRHSRPGSEGPGGPEGPGSPGAGPRGRPRRSLVPVGLAAFVVLEIWLLTLLADATSALAVLAVLVAGAVLGAAAVKRAGRRAWRGLVETVESLQPGAEPRTGPQDSRGGHGLAMLGGLLLMLPGLVSDAAGLLCLFPPTAALLRRGAERRLGRRAGFAPGSLEDTLRQARTAEEQFRIHRPDGKVVPGEVVREDGHDTRGGKGGGAR
ncbi:FxsA family membrane protein [Streptomyces sp. CNQ085]|uniref:FxsA family membrane protein n=1 Tax=Streptomyces sp. CNQ085 TaxID=2886944 RepID=UPI001F50BC71|nr:FxsA family membrane protein [Streptomyces sp. CNQ085]MCI0387034.1 FxsA family protein [Streptomyces sp. CNQ085]